MLHNLATFKLTLEFLNFVQDCVNLLAFLLLLLEQLQLLLSLVRIGNLIVDQRGLSILHQPLLCEYLFDWVMALLERHPDIRSVLDFLLQDVWPQFAQDHFEVDGLFIELVAHVSLLLELGLLSLMDLSQSCKLSCLLLEIVVQCQDLVGDVFLGKHVVLHAVL